MTVKEAMVYNPAGLSGAAAVAFAKKAGEYSCDIKIEKAPRLIRGDSLLGILNLNLVGGDTIMILADGPGEEEAVSVLVQLIESDGI